MALFFTFLASFAIVYIGFLVYFHRNKSAVGMFFLIHALSTAAWLLCNYFALNVPAQESLVWIRSVMFFATPSIFAFFLFVSNFPEDQLTISRKNLNIWSVLTLIVMLFTVTPLVFKTLTIQNSQPVPIPGIFMPVVVGYMLGLSGYTFYQIVKKYSRSSGNERKQWLFISAGLTITYTLVLSLIFIATVFFANSSYTVLSPIFVLPTVVGSAYAILRYRFLNSKVVATEILTFFLLFVELWQLLAAQSFNQLLLQTIISVTLFIVSILLIRSVIEEVKQKEQLQTLTAELADANEQLKVLDKARADFITIASHQLRTPPATIKWYLSALLGGDYGKVPDELKDILEKTNRTNNGQISLIDDMLNVSRIERGKMEFLFEPTNLLELANLAFEQLQPMAKEKKLEFKFIPPTQKPPQIMADKEKIRQVMNNLMDNALKYTKQGSVEASLTFNADEIRFAVKDTGKGIDPEEKDSIFEKYSRGKESARHSAGLGLGLYVAKIVVGQHKGKIWAESPGSNQGSSFIFTVPINSGLTQTTLVDLTKNQ